MPYVGKILVSICAAVVVVLLCAGNAATMATFSLVGGQPAAPVTRDAAAQLPAPQDAALKGMPSSVLGAGAVSGGVVLTLGLAALITSRRTTASMPASRHASLIALRAAAPDFSKELGACPPLGFWDPLGLSEFDDPAVAVAQFKRRRVIEIQHGRVSMLACIGYIVPEYFKWPGFISPTAGLKFEDIPNGLGACSKIPGAGWLQMVTFVGTIEVFNLQSTAKEYAGDYDGYGAFGLPGGAGIDDKERKEKSLLAEINNGRLAMVAIIGMFFQDGLTGSAWGDWALYTDSPLRATAAPDFSKELGACPPLGFWDPLGLSEFDDPAVAVAQFKRRRVIEIQHGRVSMLACIGYIVPEYFKWPGLISPTAGLSFEEIPNGLGACSKIPGAGWLQMVTFVGTIEVFNLQSTAKEYAGDYDGYGAFGLPGGKGIDDKEKKEKSLLAEINNGRLAMVAIIGMFFQDGLTGSAWGDWALYTDSPLRATAAPDFSKELGACPPLGFWDPLGLSEFDDPAVAVSQFKRRRVIEIQHGRVSMLACIGYIVPEYFKWPGFISPTAGLKFEDIPNGLGACSKIPGAGWLQMVTFVGTVEVFNLQSTAKEYAGDYDGYGAFGLPGGRGIDDKEKKEKSLLAEINNGRLAMVAIIGMFFQDGLTGSAWGDWALYTDSPLRATVAPDFSKELGACPPLGFWDPLGLSEFDDPAVAVAQFKRRRVIEIQHGRLSMLACIGYIVPEYFKWPGYISPTAGLTFEDIPNGLGACSKIPGAGWLQMVTFVGTIEVFNLQSTAKEYAGDYDGYGAFGLPGGKGIEDKEQKEKSLLAEINNGRLAMVAIIGMFFQDGLTGSAWGDWALYTDSPLRATAAPDFSKELGACPPLGFWDPLGLSEFDDPAVAVAQFKRRRVIEIQHGRVSMLACIGYIVPEYFKWPGYISPTAGLTFEDIPNGLGACSKIPGAGWLQMVTFVGTIEVFNLQSTAKEYAGDYDGYGAFGLPGGKGIDDKEKKEKSLLAEINNGRLAMVAIIGMFFQDGLTGSAWGDWALYTDSPLRATAAPDFSKELGACPPLGFWDPLGLSEFDDPTVAVAQFKRRRVIEIQHGRVSMLACIGYIVPEYFKWPGYISPTAGLTFEDIPNGLGACSKIPGAGWLQMVTFVGTIEVFNLQSTAKEYAGDYDGYGAFGLPGGKGIDDKEKKEKSLLAEINNGRLAMVAIIGMFFQDGLTGSAWGDWALYTDSPLRATAAPDFSNELGACPPLGFWDPLGLSEFDDPAVAVAQFKRRRVIEIQHGRVSMLACIGYIVPEYFKWPGFISPTAGLKFEDIPNGLGACSKVPGAGWLQMVTFVGTIEVFNLQSTAKEYAGDYDGYGAFGLPGGKGIDDKERKEKSLLAEINNGRLAMVAIIGMFFQDGLTGSAWGDWALYTDSPLRALASSD